MKLALALASLICIAAIAPRTADATPQGKRAALVLLKKGVQLYQSGDYDGALALFKSAYASFPSHKILLNIGTAYKALGRTIDAANSYDKYLQAKGLSKQRVAEVSKLLNALDATLARVRIQTGEAGTEVLVDGALVGLYKTPMVVRVLPGRHTLAVRSGTRHTEQAVVVVAGQVLAVTLTLKAKPVVVVQPVAAPVDTKTATNKSVPGTRVSSGPAAKVGPAAKSTRVAASPRASAASPNGASSSASPAVSAARTTVKSTMGISTGNTAASNTGRLSGLVYADFDYKARGAAVFAGLGVGIGARLELAAAALIGGEGQGLYAGATYRIAAGKVMPQVSVGVPVFFSDGARVAVRVTGGGAWAATSRVAVVVELGVEHYFSPEAGFKQTIVVPAIGIRAGL